MISQAAEDTLLSTTKTEQPGPAPNLPTPPKPVSSKSVPAPKPDEPDHKPSTPPQRPAHEEDDLRAEVRELSMALDLLKNRQL